MEGGRESSLRSQPSLKLRRIEADRSRPPKTGGSFSSNGRSKLFEVACFGLAKVTAALTRIEEGNFSKVKGVERGAVVTSRTW